MLRYFFVFRCHTTVCIWLVAVSKHFPVPRNQSWLRSENLAGSRSPAISYMRCCNKKAIALPSLKGNTKLPVILNQSELKELFSAPQLLKQRIVLTLIYSAGLRGQEVINLKLSDVDFERKTIHIRQSKYKKDRIVPLSPTMAIGLKKYIGAENPHIWLFNGKQPGSQYSIRGLSWVMRENLKKTSITKKVNLHTLRHTYATHLLEQGLNIVTLKDLLGHSEITTTMIYLHVAQCEHVKPHSPLDKLYGR
jgi:integrase/recombinase XerD